MTLEQTDPDAPAADPALEPSSPRDPWRALLDLASAPYRRAGRFAWHFARGKLGRDPVFRAMLQRGLLPPHAHVLDLGAGQGLLASLLAAVDVFAKRPGAWPAHWAAAPVRARYVGIELMPRDVARAQAALGQAGAQSRFVCGDMCTAELPPSDVVVIFDVLHYVPQDAQAALLARVRDALAPRGRLLLRVGDAAQGRGFRISQWVDRVVTMVRGHRVPPTFCRPLRDWVALLEQLGFTVKPLPMSEGTPFANVLLVADLAQAPRDAKGAA
jgi:SAM-dependent methyltransferase